MFHSEINGSALLNKYNSVKLFISFCSVISEDSFTCTKA